MKKILFISHDASRSGAPLVLLNLIKWLSTTSKDVESDVLLINDGPLKSEFELFCKNVVILKTKERIKTFGELFVSKVKNKLKVKKSNRNKLLDLIGDSQYDLIYANTIISVPYAIELKKHQKNAKVIAHIHELQSIIKEYVPNFNKYHASIDKIIAVSNQVRYNLVENWNVPKLKIEVIYPFSEVLMPKFKTEKSASFIVGACGLSYWRKGNDLFLQVARYICKNHPNLKIKFVWVGNEYIDKPIIDADIKKLGLVDKVFFIGETQEPSKYFIDFNVFLLPSREDPFPLVCIEVANHNKPIICFKNASGTSDIIEKGGGFVVPYLDIEAMAEKVIYYYNNRMKCEEDGKIANKLFGEFNAEQICPKLYSAIINIYR